MQIKTSTLDIPASLSSKLKTLDLAIQKIEQFEQENPNFPAPTLYLDYHETNPHEYWPDKQEIQLYIPSCSTEAKNFNQWSVPGSIVDRTAHGALLYQYGLHVLNVWKLKNPKFFNHWKTFLNQYGELGRPINASNKNSIFYSFADTFRLFLSNPMLLMAGMPERYILFTLVFDLKNSTQWEWQSAFDYYRDPRFLKSNEKWVTDNIDARQDRSYVDDFASFIENNMLLKEKQHEHRTVL